MAQVTVYTTTYCPYCTRAKALLTKKSVAFTEIDVTTDDATRKWLTETTGRHTVPQVFINNRPVGGCDDLYALDRAGHLEALLAEPPSP